MAITNEDIVSLHDQAKQLLAEIEKIKTLSGEMAEATGTLSDIRDGMTKFIKEVEDLVKQTRKIMEALGKIDSTGLNESLNTVKSQCDRLVKDIGKLKDSIDSKYKELLSAFEILGLKLDNLKALMEKSNMELVKVTQDGHIKIVTEIGGAQKATAQGLEKLDKSLTAKLADLTGKQNEFRLGMEKKLRLIKYSVWGGLLVIIILQGLSLFLAYYR